MESIRDLAERESIALEAVEPVEQNADEFSRERLLQQFDNSDTFNPFDTALDRLEQEDKEFIAYWRMKALIEGIKTPWVKSAVAFQYGTGCRVGELVGAHGAPGICWGDTELTGNGTLFVLVFTLKNRAHPIRQIPITKREQWIIDAAMEPWNGNPHVPGKKIIDYTVRTIENQVHKHLDLPDKPVKTHSLRHSRLSHLVQMFNYPPAKWVKYAGHSDYRQFMRYTHLYREDLERPFLERMP